MLAYSNPAIVYHAVPTKDSQQRRKPTKLVAQWRTVNGHLKFEWVAVGAPLEP
ncbi:MAG: hypothetical protein AAGI45_16710 [Cyanobacteria bacterium P01_H01_bin.26]